jgi:hypothetical protein
MPSSSRNDDREFEAAMRLMRRHDPASQEEGFQVLHGRAAAHLDRLLRAFAQEVDHGLRCWLLELIGDAESPKAMETLADEMRSDDESLRFWAIRGLVLLNTKEARTLLWEAQSWELGTKEATASFRAEIRERIDQARDGDLR